MLCYHEKDTQLKLDNLGRYHPWTVTTKTPDGKYVDFKRYPELISETLEDLRLVDGTVAAQAVVEFITWANGPDSIFETNDFGLRAIRPNQSGVSTAKLELHGRVTLLFRDLRLNTSERIVQTFLSKADQQLKAIDTHFKEACWGWCTWPHCFTELLEANQPAEGDCLSYMVWSWGNDVSHTHEHLLRAFRNLRTALERAAHDLREHQGRASPR
ncbi:hypothetical protein [Sinorhizobium meliloti]|uniref:hypothetical protein n=1 Tax=Rhizobium meliloti TaxID=382 RepID=UPI000FDB791C|nr:hypothetical protein [Sinorhizobium meliloti]RVK93388.1 hypothetical protein CN152_23285 [Sinorhizobium meliloti]RVN47466.1 hypothetical protein CN113_12925 [Sinorhizobium meliloti]